ncbi:hypothetical protein HN873_060661 [Arachis hypogaea]|nr:Myb/SANT-like domain-containing protein [Arachis hypogaea]
MDRHVWTDEETRAFVDFTEELVIERRRANVGQFRLGSFEKLATKMNEIFSGGSFQISHCKNKVKRLKEKYQFVTNMTACSNFGCDDVKQCVVVDNKEILAAYLKRKRLDAFAQAMINTHEEKKVGDMLSELDFIDDKIISIALKFSTNSQLEKTFWSLGHN